MDGRRARLGRRAVVAAGAGLAVGAIGAPGAAAFRGWCRSDPLVAIDGELADVFVSAPARVLLAVEGPTEYVITTPKGVAAELILAGPGFGRGERVSFATSRKLERTGRGIELVVAVRLPTGVDLPMAVEFAPRIVGILTPEVVEGESNRWVRLRTTF